MAIRHVRNMAGFSLIELLIVIAIVGVVVGMSVLSFNMIYSQQLNEAKAQVYSDLKKLRVDAVTTSNDPNSRGFGIKFTSETQYELFEFYDSNGDFDLDAGENTILNTINLPVNTTVKAWRSGSLQTPNDEDIRIYDKRGMLRKMDWSSASDKTFVITHANYSVQKCIGLNKIAIREGLWNGSVCQ